MSGHTAGPWVATKDRANPWWIVLGPEGEPVESFRTREDAQARRDAIAASYREPIPE